VWSLDAGLSIVCGEVLAQVTQLQENKKNIQHQIDDCGLSIHLTIAKPDVVKTYPLA
jgi:hypothetical protein